MSADEVVHLDHHTLAVHMVTSCDGSGEPEIFFTKPSYDGVPLLMVRLDRVGAQRLAELVTDAWRMRSTP